MIVCMQTYTLPHRAVIVSAPALLLEAALLGQLGERRFAGGLIAPVALGEQRGDGSLDVLGHLLGRPVRRATPTSPAALE